MHKKVKLILVSLFFAIPLFASSFKVPKPEGYVRDLTRTLTLEQEASLELTSQELEKKTGAQVAVLVINSLGSEPIENAAVKTFESWGIGQKGKDNGILFLIALKDKKMRIEVGYGLEGVLPDGKTGALLDSYVVPYFKKGLFAQGILSGQQRIVLAIDPAFKQSGQVAVVQPKPQKKMSPLEAMIYQNFLIMVLVLIVGLLIISPSFRAVLLVMLLSGVGGRGGSGGGFNGGGGFGGFGSGRSGGGGASRDW